MDQELKGKNIVELSANCTVSSKLFFVNRLDQDSEQDPDLEHFDETTTVRLCDLERK